MEMMNAKNERSSACEGVVFSFSLSRMFLFFLSGLSGWLGAFLSDNTAEATNGSHAQSNARRSPPGYGVLAVEIAHHTKATRMQLTPAISLPTAGQ